MKRRLYFLLPDAGHASDVVQQLEQYGVLRSQIHVLAGRGSDAAGLPQATPQQQRDVAALVEKILWYTNLAVFSLALLLLIVMLLMQTGGFWLLLPVAAMILSFLAGFGFTSRVPNVHLGEFSDAMRHAEILLMVDVPTRQVEAVERLVRRQHPEAAPCGVGWSIAHLPL